MDSEIFVKSLDTLTIFTWSPWASQGSQNNPLIRVVHAVATLLLSVVSLGTLHVGTLFWMDRRAWKENAPLRLKDIFVSLFPHTQQYIDRRKKALQIAKVDSAIHNQSTQALLEHLSNTLENLDTHKDQLTTTNHQHAQQIQALEVALEPLRMERHAVSQKIKTAAQEIERRATVLNQLFKDAACLLQERAQWIAQLESVRAPIYSTITRMQKGIHEVQRLRDILPQGAWTDAMRTLCIAALDARNQDALETLRTQFPPTDFLAQVDAPYRTLKKEDFLRFWKSLKASRFTRPDQAYTAKKRNSLSMFGFWKDPQCSIWVSEKDETPRIHFSWKKVSEDTPFSTFSFTLPNMDSVSIEECNIYISNDVKGTLPKTELIERALLPILEHRDASYCSPQTTCQVPYALAMVSMHGTANWIERAHLYISTEMESLAPLWCLEQFLESLKQVQMGLNIRIWSIQNGEKRKLESEQEIREWIKNILYKIIRSNSGINTATLLMKKGRGNKDEQKKIMSFYSPFPLAQEDRKFILRATRGLDNDGVKLCKILGGLLGLSAFKTGSRRWVWGSLFSKKILAGLLANSCNPYFTLCPYEQWSQEDRHLCALAIALVDDEIRGDPLFQNMPWFLVLNSALSFRIKTNSQSIFTLLLAEKERLKDKVWWQKIYTMLREGVPDEDQDHDAEVIRYWKHSSHEIVKKIHADPEAREFIETLPWGDLDSEPQQWEKYPEVLANFGISSPEQFKDPVSFRKFLNKLSCMLETRYSDLLPAIHVMLQGAQETYEPISKQPCWFTQYPSWSITSYFFGRSESTYHQIPHVASAWSDKGWTPPPEYYAPGAIHHLDF